MQKFSKYLLSLAIIGVLVIPMVTLVNGAHAQGSNINNNMYGTTDINNGLNGSLTSKDPRTVVGQIITVVLGFLGVIAVGIILLGGFKWMTGGGNEDKVGEAKKLLGAGVIGLVIILSAWAIATFVINAIFTATN